MPFIMLSAVGSRDLGGKSGPQLVNSDAIDRIEPKKSPADPGAYVYLRRSADLIEVTNSVNDIWHTIVRS